MPAGGKPTLYHQFYEHEPHLIGLETLWFCKAFDPDGPRPDDDPDAIRLVGPASPGECATVARGIKLVLWHLGYTIEETSGVGD